MKNADKFFDNIKIETPHGIVPFKGIRKMPVKMILYKVLLENGKYCIVSEKHGFVVCGIEVKVEELIVGESKLQCDDNEYYVVTDISRIEEEDWVYDLLGVENEDSSYFANGISHHNCSFTGSTHTLIDGDVLASLSGMSPPENGIFDDGYYLIYVPPKRNHLYAFGIDTAQGANGDYSVVNIFDITDYRLTGRIEQVAVWARNDKGIFDFAKVILDPDKKSGLIHQWNQPFINIETNNLGDVLVKILYHEYGYEHIFYDTNKGQYGTYASPGTKSLALTHFKDDVETEKMIIRDQDMIKELGYFEEVKDGVFQARKGREFHDDRVASAYWVSYMLKDPWFEDAYQHRLEVMGIINNYEKPIEQLEAESTLNAFMGAIGNGLGDMNAEQALWETELWLDEEDDLAYRRQQAIKEAHRRRINELHQQNLRDMARFNNLR